MKKIDVIPYTRQVLSPSPPRHMTVTSGYVGLRKTQKGARLLTEKIEVESRQQTAFRTIMELEDSCSDNSDFLTLADKMIEKKKKKQSVSLIRNG